MGTGQAHTEFAKMNKNKSGFLEPGEFDSSLGKATVPEQKK
jgi:hypothetical protein